MNVNRHMHSSNGQGDGPGVACWAPSGSTVQLGRPCSMPNLPRSLQCAAVPQLWTLMCAQKRSRVSCTIERTTSNTIFFDAHWL